MVAALVTARAFTVDNVAGTFAGIAMGLNAVATAVLAPVVLRWFKGSYRHRARGKPSIAMIY